ncbi:DUF935 domain-containing protein [Asticcacaulis sp. YBE204]|uniref:DUF935 domain-containing protein n=1 Tax=Asticcacaulis sp. YBE204 TaxID=1282363 RepID=UPI0003C40BA2|nr:DUF935 family protein [Asticcacaulis sp. YBE204]ESQ78500.1 hypothetical protein AEYBE204_13185 [Asticcacaulis sp. YBE204]
MVDRKKLAFSAADIKSLNGEIAAPTVAGVRQALSPDPTNGLTPQRVLSIMNAAADGNADAYFELAEAMEEKDLHYQAVLGVRKRAVAGLDISVEAFDDTPEKKKDADLIRSWLKRDTLQLELFDILDAIGKGVSFTEIEWDHSRLPWLPVVLKRRDQRFFEFDRVTQEIPLLKGGKDGTSAEATPLPLRAFIYHNHPAKTGLPLRGGLARGIAWAYLFKNFSLKDWVIFAEVYGHPVRLGKYGPEATEEQKRILMRAVQSIGTDMAGIIPDSMIIEFIKAGVAGDAKVFSELCAYLDMQISKAVLGQTGTTDATTGGFGSSGQVHNEVRRDIQLFDAVMLAATLNRDLVRPIIDVNHGVPADGNYPRIIIGQKLRITKEDMEMYAMFVEMGGEVEATVVGDRLNLPEPPEAKPGDKPIKLLKPRSKAPENPAAENPGEDPTAPDVPKQGPKAPLTPLKAAKTRLKDEGAVAAAALSAAHLQPGTLRDDIDDLIDAAADEWTEVMAPQIDPIEALAAASSSYEEFMDGLSVLADGDPAKVRDLLGRTLFTARLAGETGALHSEDNR